MNYEIDITYGCNLSCKWCNRLCGTQYRASQEMSLEQFEQLVLKIAPTLQADSTIRICGGEPMLHSKIFDILDIAVKVLRPLLKSPINIMSNGFGEEVVKILAEVRKRYDTEDNPYLNPYFAPSYRSNPKQFRIIISKSTSTAQKNYNKSHRPIFRASIDYLNQDQIDAFAETCLTSARCGLGATTKGFYPCCMGNSIDTIFGLQAGLDYPPSPEELRAQKRRICKYCYMPCDPSIRGIFFKSLKELITPDELISPTYAAEFKKIQD